VSFDLPACFLSRHWVVLLYFLRLYVAENEVRVHFEMSLNFAEKVGQLTCLVMTDLALEDWRTVLYWN